MRGQAFARIRNYEEVIPLAKIKITRKLLSSYRKLKKEIVVLELELVEMMEEVKFHEISTQFVPPALTPDHLVIDGLFGSGLNKPLSGGFAAVVKYINSSPAMVVAIDIPSGLMGEENTFNVKANIIRADVTFSLQLPKLAFLFAENTEFVGEWEVLDIQLSEDGIEEMETNYEMLEIEQIRSLIKPRKQFAHKGNFGHALLIAGSKGMAGASVLAARACLRSGVGLLTVHAPMCNNDILQTSIPEAIVETDINETCFAVPTDTDDYQAVGIGPGLGRNEETEAALLEQLEHCQTPVVVDADALNILANPRHALTPLPKGSILTPHPKELERLTGKCQDSYERLMKACELAKSSFVNDSASCVHFYRNRSSGFYGNIFIRDNRLFFTVQDNCSYFLAGFDDLRNQVSQNSFRYFPDINVFRFCIGVSFDFTAEQVLYTFVLQEQFNDCSTFVRLVVLVEQNDGRCHSLECKSNILRTFVGLGCTEQIF